jgi:hypothetical protein
VNGAEMAPVQTRKSEKWRLVPCFRFPEQIRVGLQPSNQRRKEVPVIVNLFSSLLTLLIGQKCKTKDCNQKWAHYENQWLAERSPIKSDENRK